MNRGEGGQAVVEFIFALLAMLMILMFVLMMFDFAQQVFFGLVDVRKDMLDRFRENPQYTVAKGQEIRNSDALVARVAELPFIRTLVQDVPEWRRFEGPRWLVLRGGAKPDLYDPPKVVSCATATGLALQWAETDNTPPISIPAGILGGGLCLGIVD